MKTGKRIPKSLDDLAKNRRNKFALIQRDETGFWKEDIATKAKQIKGVYLVDLTKPTHCCELSTSYYATFVKNIFDECVSLDEDELTTLENHNGGEEGMYVAGGSTFDIVKMYKSGTLEEAEENERTNPTFII